jgi:hypothetical protein
VCLLSPLIAPPNKNTNNVTKTIGCSVTSSSCSGLRLIRTSDRHASVSACRSARAGVMLRARPGPVAVTVVIGCLPRRCAR